MSDRREIYRVAGTMKAIRQWARERGIHWSHVVPITMIEQTMGLPQGERLIVTGPYHLPTQRIIHAAKPFMSIEFQPTIPGHMKPDLDYGP